MTPEAIRAAFDAVADRSAAMEIGAAVYRACVLGDESYDALVWTWNREDRRTVTGRLFTMWSVRNLCHRFREKLKRELELPEPEPRTPRTARWSTAILDQLVREAMTD